MRNTVKSQRAGGLRVAMYLCIFNILGVIFERMTNFAIHVVLCGPCTADVGRGFSVYMVLLILL